LDRQNTKLKCNQKNDRNKATFYGKYHKTTTVISSTWSEELLWSNCIAGRRKEVKKDIEKRGTTMYEVLQWNLANWQKTRILEKD